MNTNPDDPMLALWLDDELHGPELDAFESRPDFCPEWISARDEVRQWRSLISSAVPATLTPTYPDFFNGRVMRAIREQAANPVVVPKRAFFGRAFMMPLAACAGMVFAFWLGAQTQSNSPEPVVVEGAPRAIPVEPFVYTPETGVIAERFESAHASATVIVLNGVEAIPDAMDFSETTSLNEAGKRSATAALESHAHDPLGL